MRVVRRPDLGPGTPPGTGGYVTATRVDDEWEFLATVESHLPPEDIDEFCVWVDEVVRRMVEYGPAADGWEPNAEGGWRWSAPLSHRSAG